MQVLKLTERDLVLLNALAAGMGYKQIGPMLGTSEQGAKNRARKVYDFLGADNAAHAVAQAMRRGLIK